MILGSGLDLLEIDRIKAVMKRHPEFLDRFFSEAERTYFESRKGSLSVVAANFAGKEAFSKALGSGIRGFSLKEVELLRDQAGAPYLRLSGKAKEKAESRGIQRFHVSLSHSRDCAAAVVIAEADCSEEVK